MADPQVKTTVTEEKSGAAATQQPPPPQIIADDNARKILAVIVIAQFLVFVGYLIYTAAKIDNMQLIIGAEITFVTTVLNYYFGSSSGSTAKSAAAKDKL